MRFISRQHFSLRKISPLVSRIVANRSFWVFIIFLAASVFRLFFLNLIEFKGDEAGFTRTITDFYAKPQLFQIGSLPSSVWHNFPLFYYLLIIIGFISRDPQYLSFVIALINVYMILFFFFMVDTFYGRTTAIFSSLVLSLSPWAILFSRKIWFPNLLILALIPFLYFFHKLVITKKGFAVFPLFVFLAFLVLIHGSAVFFTISVVLTLFLLKIQFNKKWAIAGFIVGLLPAIPFIIYQLSSSSLCPDCTNFQIHKFAIDTFDVSSFLKPFQIISSATFNQILGDSYADFLHSSPIVSFAEVLFPLEGFFIICSSYFILRYEKKYAFLPLLCFLLPVFYYLMRIPSFMHHFIIILPLLAILYGMFFTQVLKQTRNSLLQALLIVLFIFLLFSKIIFEINFYHFLSVTKDIKGDYGTIYSEQQIVAH